MHLSKYAVTIPMVTLCSIVLLSGCKGKSLPIPFVPKPTRVAIEIETAGDINQTSDGRASPLVVRIYQLKSPSVFNDAEFFALYDDDERTLGGDIVRQHEMTLKPNEKRELAFEPPEETQAIGVLAAFRDYEHTQWRAVTAVRPRRTNTIHIMIQGNRLMLQ